MRTSARVSTLLLTGLLLTSLAPAAFADVVIHPRPPFGKRDVAEKVTISLGPYASSAYRRCEVEPGATLYGIALEHLGDGKRWPEVLRLSFLPDPQSLQVGSTCVVPPKDPPAPGSEPPHYDFFLWAAPLDRRPVPLVPGEDLPSGRWHVLAVDHVHLDAFFDALPKRADGPVKLESLAVQPWVAVSEPIGDAAGAVEVTAIADGVVKTRQDVPELGPLSGLPPVGELPPADPFAQAPPRPPVPDVPAVVSDPSRAPEEREATDAAAGARANPFVVAAVILAIVLVAFVLLRRMYRRESEKEFAA